MEYVIGVILTVIIVYFTWFLIIPIIIFLLHIALYVVPIVLFVIWIRKIRHTATKNPQDQIK
jgi:hypothetical protein